MPKFNLGGLVDAVAYGALDEILGMGRSDDGISRPNKYEVTLYPPTGSAGTKVQVLIYFQRLWVRY